MQHQCNMCNGICVCAWTCGAKLKLPVCWGLRIRRWQCIRCVDQSLMACGLKTVSQPRGPASHSSVPPPARGQMCEKPVSGGGHWIPCVYLILPCWCCSESIIVNVVAGRSFQLKGNNNRKHIYSFYIFQLLSVYLHCLVWLRELRHDNRPSPPWACGFPAAE